MMRSVQLQTSLLQQSSITPEESRCRAVGEKLAVIRAHTHIRVPVCASVCVCVFSDPGSDACSAPTTADTVVSLTADPAAVSRHKMGGLALADLAAENSHT